MITKEIQPENHSPNRSQRVVVLSIFALALTVRSLTAYLIGTHIDDAGWFPFGIYNTFDAQAHAILDGTASAFWITDASQTLAAIYPPGYSLWLAFLYSVSGTRSIYFVQIVQLILDSASVLLLVGIGVTAFNWRKGLWIGVLAALSPLLAVYGAMPLADAPTSWLVIGGIWMLVSAVKKENIYFAVGAGLMIGASCWFRSNALFLAAFWAVAVFICLRASFQKRTMFASAVLLGTFLLVAPIVIRNSIAFQAFVPTGLGAGTNLWEGIGETSRAEEFGAIYGDRALIEKERSEMGRADDETVSLYWPNGVERDRERMRKAMNVIVSHPFWYAGVMAKRMIGHLKYFGSPSPIYGSSGFNITPSKSLPPTWQYLPLTVSVTALGWVQSVMRFFLLPLMLLGIVLGFRENARITLVILATVFYYLVVGTFMHSEIRYSLPMQAVMFVFAGIATIWMINLSRQFLQAYQGRKDGS